jgi:pectin methylesterase-like acyl-CoA thioesterase
MARVLEIIDTPSYNKDWIDTLRATEANNVLMVGPHMRYTTVQAAVDAAVTGQVIVVSPGTYTENVTVPNDVQLTLTGSGVNTVLMGDLDLGDSGSAKGILIGDGFTVRQNGRNY